MHIDGQFDEFPKTDIIYVLEFCPVEPARLAPRRLIVVRVAFPIAGIEL